MPYGGTESTAAIHTRNDNTQLNTINTELMQLMIASKRQCQKLCLGQHAFSPHMQLWLKCIWVLKLILTHKTNWCGNYSNLWHAVFRANLKSALTMTKPDLCVALQHCRELALDVMKNAI